MKKLSIIALAIATALPMASFANTTITGVAHVDATNRYNNVNGVLYGSSLMQVRGTHELNIANGNINKLVIGNQSIDLLPNRKSRTGVAIVRSGNTTLNVGHYLTYAKHGNYMVNNATTGESSAAVFYQGYETPVSKVPTTGKATYRGVAIQSYVDAVNAYNSAASLEAKSVFNVDFSNKRVNGTITPINRRYSAVNLSGSIQGNRLVGDYVNGYESMDGRFFGPNAEEIAGRYYVIEPGKRYINGTFGAKK